MDKKYWDVKDYEEVLTYIEFRLPKGDQYPNINDALTAPVFKKLVDKENLTIVLEDKSLGVKHREEWIVKTSLCMIKNLPKSSIYSCMWRSNIFRLALKPSGNPLTKRMRPV
jgi:hypothetical protein